MGTSPSRFPGVPTSSRSDRGGRWRAAGAWRVAVACLLGGVLPVGLAGCASTGQLQAGVEAERTGDYDPLLARYGPNCAVGRPRSQMATVFASKGWRESYRDRQWVVLVRQGSPQ